MKSLSVTDSKGRKRVLKPHRDGTFHVTDPKLAKKLKDEGLGVAGVATPLENIHAVGYTCSKCGFGSYFKKCSRCGEING